MTGPGKQPEYSEDETGGESTNEINEDKFMSRLRSLIEITRQSEELTGAEVIGLLEVAKLDIYTSLPKEEAETDDED